MMQQTFIGVDVAKSWLDIHHPKQRSLRIDNTPKAARAFAGACAKGLSSRRAADTTASSVRRWKPRRCPSAASIPDKPATSPALWA